MTETRNQAVAAPGAALPAARFRHERKHYITPADHAALCQRLAPVMERDPHAGPDGTYTVHSLYFDDWRDTALREKIDGLPRREKFRIRYYNGDLSFIRLEKKSKVRGQAAPEGSSAPTDGQAAPEGSSAPTDGQAALEQRTAPPQNRAAASPEGREGFQLAGATGEDGASAAETGSLASLGVCVAAVAGALVFAGRYQRKKR